MQLDVDAAKLPLTAEDMPSLSLLPSPSRSRSPGCDPVRGNKTFSAIELPICETLPLSIFEKLLLILEKCLSK